jgi:DASH complex subunit SPC19
MSRLSRANVKARESIFTSGPEQYIGDIQARCPPDLEECVLAMEDCCEEVLLVLPYYIVQI